MNYSQLHTHPQLSCLGICTEGPGELGEVSDVHPKKEDVEATAKTQYRARALTMCVLYDHLLSISTESVSHCPSPLVDHEGRVNINGSFPLKTQSPLSYLI